MYVILLLGAARQARVAAGDRAQVVGVAGGAKVSAGRAGAADASLAAAGHTDAGRAERVQVARIFLFIAGSAAARTGRSTVCSVSGIVVDRPP